MIFAYKMRCTNEIYETAADRTTCAVYSVLTILFLYDFTFYVAYNSIIRNVSKFQQCVSLQI